MNFNIDFTAKLVAPFFVVALMGGGNVASAADYETSRAFAMGGAAWSAPQLLENADSGDSKAPQVAVDSLGNALAVWRQESADDSISIWAARFISSNGWQEAELISINRVGNEPYQAAAPQIAMTPSGRAVVVWHEQGDSQELIWASKFDPAIGWNVAQTIGDNTLGDAKNPRVAIDSRGNAIAVWEQDDSNEVGITDSSIWANRFAANSGWGTAEKIEADAAEYRNPEIVIGSTGNALVLWENVYDALGDSYPMANRYLRGGGWSSPVQIEMGDLGDTSNIDIALDSSGNAVAVWELYNYNYFDVWASHFSPSEGWSEAEKIETFESGEAINPQVTFDSKGNAVALWEQYEYPTTEIWLNQFSTEGGWSEAEMFEGGYGEASRAPEIAFDSEGNAMAVWIGDETGTDSVWSRQFVSGGVWGAAALVESDESGRALSPHIAAGPRGKALTVWVQYDVDGNANIWASRFE